MHERDGILTGYLAQPPLVDEARAAELTQREIALLLGMTEEGLRKAQKSYHGRGRSYGGRLAS